ncbi:hypothetical protein MKW94_028013 [Papaver nudicaule]|uniref:Pentatricopeptide repeat-containing protein n=1 Tax=Papaver nudicaule TaxID=74823 RepID=A0AA41VR11_PAPNU|nr:hypothetical protein [Papaver nudicaule]
METLIPKISTKKTNFFRSRKTRKFPLLPFKAKWQQNFDQQQAMETLITESTTTTQNPNLLSLLIDSFTKYKCDPTPSAYSFVIKTLTRNSQFDQIPLVLNRLEKVEKFDTPERFFINLIKLYGDGLNQIENAVDLFYRIPNFRCVPTVYSLNALLSVLCKSKQGLLMVNQVLLKSTEVMSIRLEESSFFIMITALCRIKKFGYAIELLHMMLAEYGYEPDYEMYSRIFMEVCERGDYDEVMGFLEEFRKVGFVLSGENYSDLIRVLVKNGKGKEGLDMLYRMKSDGMKPDVVCYTRVLEGVISSRDFEKAEELFDEMLVLGVEPNVYTFNVYINGLCKQNKIDEGFKMVEYMEKLDCKPDVVTYNTLIGAVCKVGEVKRGKEVLRMMGLKGIGGNVHTYRILIDGLIGKGELLEACGLFEEMSVKGFLPRSSSLDAVIARMCEQGLVGEALKVLNKIVERNVAPGEKTWEVLLCESKLDFNDATRNNFERLVGV